MSPPPPEAPAAITLPTPVDTVDCASPPHNVVTTIPSVFHRLYIGSVRERMGRADKARLRADKARLRADKARLRGDIL